MAVPGARPDGVQTPGTGGRAWYRVWHRAGN